MPMTALWLLRLATWLALEKPPPPPETVRVATIAYPGGSPSDYGCKNDFCAFDLLIRAAKDAGAAVVVTPEYATPQHDGEPRVAVGQHPSKLTAPTQAYFAALADELDLYLAIDVETENALEQGFNSLVVFDPRGVLVARHDKIELFEGERQTLQPGQDVHTLDTPYGRFGMLICADLYTEPAIHRALIEEHEAQIILVSAAWTVPLATQWQAAFARDWDVYVVAANASLGSGRGGGVFDPRGRAVARPGPLRHTMLADIPVAPIEGFAGSYDPQ